jgi:signal transduction histidine kinase
MLPSPPRLPVCSSIAHRSGRAAPRPTLPAERLAAATRAVSTRDDLTSVLRELVTAAAELVGARYGAVGVLDDSGERLVHFVTVGFSDKEVAAIGAGTAGVLRNHPARIFLGAPICVDGQPLGRIYLTDKTGGRTFTDEDAALVTLVAAQAAVALQTARLQEHAERALAELQALTAERSRTAMDMHDGAVQRLFGVGMALQSAASTLGDGGTEGVAAALVTAVDEIDAAMCEIRAYVRDLRPSDLADAALRRV